MMKRHVNSQGLAVVLAAVITAGTVSAQQSSATSVRPAAPQSPQTPQNPPTPPNGQAQTPQTQQPLGGGQMAPIDHYIVGTAKPPQVPGSEMVDMTLEEAIQVTLEHNLSLQAAKLNPAMQDYTLENARAVWVPVLNGAYSYQNVTTESNFTVDGRATTQTGANSYTAGVTQNVPWYGGNYSLSFVNSRNSNNALSTVRPLSYNSSLRFSYTQPLLQGMSTDQNRVNISTDVVQRQVVDLQLLTTIENTKASVRGAYWNLKAAIERIEINRRAEAQAQTLLDNDKTEVQIGTMAEIDTAQPAAALAAAQGQTLAAMIAWQQADLAFKQLVVSGPDDPLFTKTINPVDLPTVGSEPSVDIPAAVKTALAQRTDIQEAVKGLEQTDLSFKLSQNQIMPQLNLTGGFTSAGLGGPTTQTPNSGFGDALTSVAAFDEPTWTFGAQFTYQIGMQANRATLARAQLAYDQQRANLKVTQLGVVSDVTAAGLNVENAYKQYQAAVTARVAQEAATNAEITRFGVGLSNNFNVITQQNTLTSDQLAELNALINYINALADFDRKQLVGGVTLASGGGVSPVTSTVTPSVTTTTGATTGSSPTTAAASSGS